MIYKNTTQKKATCCLHGGGGNLSWGCSMYPRRKDIDINLTSIMVITYNLILSHTMLTLYYNKDYYFVKYFYKSTDLSRHHFEIKSYLSTATIYFCNGLFTGVLFLIFCLFFVCFSSLNVRYDFHITGDSVIFMSLFCGDVPFIPSYGVCISQLVRFACICNYVSNFNDRNLVIMENLLIPRISF